jgi:hypothetical protein
MEQLLLLTFTEKKSGKAMRMDNVKEDLATLTEQMKGYIDTAGNDLLQPRKEAIQQLLKKAVR